MIDLAEKKKTLCGDCTEDPATCGKNPLDCMKEAELYFRLYEEVLHLRKGIRKEAG